MNREEAVMQPTDRKPLAAIGVVLALASVYACTARDRPAASAWQGAADTLESGTILVSNPAVGMWDEVTAWRVVEEVRIGALSGGGPDMFGMVQVLEVDPTGRLWVFEGQAQELRVFNRDGTFVRTIGREGGGPGEFARVIGMAWSPSGDLWMVDPANARISVVDTSGAYVGSHGAIGGLRFMPWPGGVDHEGRLWHYGLDVSRAPEPGMLLIAHDAEMNPVDTVRVPEYQGEREVFEARSERGFARMAVPFTPGLEWRFDPRGYIWFMLTGEYRIVQCSLEGDTLRIISRDFEPPPVTAEDVDSAMVELEWIMEQGGRVDRSRIPDTKPPVDEFFLDDEGNIWVLPITSIAEQGRLLEVFDPEGRYLGQVELAFPRATFPRPVFRDGFLYAVTEDELEVPYIVRARIEKP
jgi:sugar lactone lactonase YvrE